MQGWLDQAGDGHLDHAEGQHGVRLLRGVPFKRARIQVRAAANNLDAGADIVNEMIFVLAVKLNALPRCIGTGASATSQARASRRARAQIHLNRRQQLRRRHRQHVMRVCRATPATSLKVNRSPPSLEGSRRGAAAQAEDEAPGAPPRSRLRFMGILDSDRRRMSARAPSRTAAGAAAP